MKEGNIPASERSKKHGGISRLGGAGKGKILNSEEKEKFLPETKARKGERNDFFFGGKGGGGFGNQSQACNREERKGNEVITERTEKGGKKGT